MPVKIENKPITEKRYKGIRKFDTDQDRITKVREWLEKCPDLKNVSPIPEGVDLVDP